MILSSRLVTKIFTLRVTVLLTQFKLSINLVTSYLNSQSNMRKHIHQPTLSFFFCIFQTQLTIAVDVLFITFAIILFGRSNNPQSIIPNKNWIKIPVKKSIIHRVYTVYSPADIYVILYLHCTAHRNSARILMENDYPWCSDWLYLW